MAYGYNYNYYVPNYYPNMYPQMQPQQMTTPTTPTPTVDSNKMPPISGVGWVDGINAAKAQNIPYGSSYLFLDSKEPYFYIKTVGYDGVPQPLFISKYKQIKEEDLTQPATPPPTEDYVKKSDLDTKLSELSRFVTEEELENKITQIIQEKMSAKPQRKIIIKGEE